MPRDVTQYLALWPLRVTMSHVEGAPPQFADQVLISMLRARAIAVASAWANTLVTAAGLKTSSTRTSGLVPFAEWHCSVDFGFVVVAVVVLDPVLPELPELAEQM
jgi:hypothetical protein